MSIPLPAMPSIETITKWVKYWRKFKGKRVRIFLRDGLKVTYNMPNNMFEEIIKPLKFGDYSIELNLVDSLTGTIDDVIENPLGILLKDLIGTNTKNVDMTFIPLSEITKMDFLKNLEKP